MTIADPPHAPEELHHNLKRHFRRNTQWCLKRQLWFNTGSTHFIDVLAKVDVIGLRIAPSALVGIGRLELGSGDHNVGILQQSIGSRCVVGDILECASRIWG